MFFFFKQKTAYEIRHSLVGSERCIGDRYKANGSVWGNILAGGGVGYAVDRNTGAGFDYPTVITVSLRSLNPGPTAADSSAFISSAQPPAAVSAETVVANAGVAAAAPKAPEIGQSSR